MFPYFPKLMDIIGKLNSLHSSSQFKSYLFLQKSDLRSMPNYTTTRWYSISDLLEAGSKLKNLIRGFQDYRSKENKNNLRKGVDFFDIDEFTKIEIYSDFLKQFKITMKELESDSNETIFYALQYIIVLYYDVCDNIISNGFQEAAFAFRTGIIKRFKKYHAYNYLNTLLLAAFLNPYLVWDELIIPNEDLPPILHNYADQMFHYLQKIAPGAFADEANRQGQVILRRRGQIMNNSQNECEIMKRIQREANGKVQLWWNSHMDMLPNLYKVALDLLSLRATSCSVERTFSKGRYILNDYVGAMNPKKMAQRVLMYCNKKLAEEAIDEMSDI